MSYFSDMGELPPSAWCSKVNPTCAIPLSKICKPMTAEVLETSKRIQRLVNRKLAATTGKLIDVDGRPGPKTTAAINEVLGTDFPDCNRVMVDLNQIEDEVASRTLVFQPVADPKPKSPPSVVTPEGEVKHPKTAGMGGLLGAAALIAGGVLVYHAVEKGPKRKGKKKRSSSYWF